MTSHQDSHTHLHRTLLYTYIHTQTTHFGNAIRREESLRLQRKSKLQEKQQ